MLVNHKKETKNIIEIPQMEQKSITLEKIDVLIEKLRTKPTINSIFYFTKVLKKCLGGADTNQE